MSSRNQWCSAPQRSTTRVVGQFYDEMDADDRGRQSFPMPAQTGSDPMATTLFDLIASQRITANLYAAARLGVADLIASGTTRSGELAERTGTYEPSLRRLLRGLVTIGVCRQVGIDEFELTTLGSKLAGSAEAGAAR